MRTKTLLEGTYKAKPIRAIDKFNSRFAYKLIVNGKPIAGEWELDSVHVNKGTFTYKRIDEKKTKVFKL